MGSFWRRIRFVRSQDVIPSSKTSFLGKAYPMTHSLFNVFFIFVFYLLSLLLVFVLVFICLSFVVPIGWYPIFLLYFFLDPFILCVLYVLEWMFLFCFIFQRLYYFLYFVVVAFLLFYISFPRSNLDYSFVVVFFISMSYFSFCFGFYMY